MANSDPLVDGPPTKKAKIGGDANGKKGFVYYFFTFLRTAFCQEFLILTFLYYQDLLSLNDELPDDIMSWGSDSGAANGLSNGSLDGLVPASNSITVSQTGPVGGGPGPGQMNQSNMGMRPGPGGPGGMNQMGSMANPGNQNMTLVNALAGKAPNNSISDTSMTSMGGPMQGRLVASSAQVSQPNSLPAVVSSMSAPNMMSGPGIRPGMNMGPGMGGPQTIMTGQMPNGPNTMVRTVGGMVRPGGPMQGMIRPGGGMITGQPRMMVAGNRMAITVS